MSQVICSLIESEQEVGKDAISKEDAKKIMKEELITELVSTNESISELKDLLMIQLNKSA